MLGGLFALLYVVLLVPVGMAVNVLYTSGTINTSFRQLFAILIWVHACSRLGTSCVCKV